jgi:6-pyruvoyltetrahydropterin/6-carboxytetrahydropterin synthase
MTDQFHVRLTKDYLVFSCAHFITFNGNICERLHGHNYGLEIEVSGPLDENHYVIDFIALRDAAKTIVDRLDHHVLLPTGHDQIVVKTTATEVVATFDDRRWVFPATDCIMLPVYNTTAEAVAKYIGGELIQELSLGGRIACDRLRVGVDENNGQWGYWTTHFKE